MRQFLSLVRQLGHLLLTKEETCSTFSSLLREGEGEGEGETEKERGTDLELLLLFVDPTKVSIQGSIVMVIWSQLELVGVVGRGRRRGVGRGRGQVHQDPVYLHAQTPKEKQCTFLTYWWLYRCIGKGCTSMDMM